MESAAAPGDTVEVASGLHDLGTRSVFVYDADLSIVGASPADPPVITSSGQALLQAGRDRVVLRDLELVKASNGYSLSFGTDATIERVQIYQRTGHAMFGACSGRTVIRDSVFVAPSLAVLLYGPRRTAGTTTCELRNLTVVGDISVNTGDDDQIVVAHARNLVVAGDIEGSSSDDRASARVELAYSLLGPGRSVNVVGQGHNLRGTPAFVAPGSDDYRLTARSLGRNAGTLADDTSAMALFGMLRPQGLGPDIGAHEEPAIPPFPTTQAATEIGETTATLHGTVDPHGLAGEYAFEYGPTAAYGSTTATESAGNGHGPVPAQAVLTGLAPDTRVHYRLVTSGLEGTAHGADWTLTTPATPDPPVPPPAPAPTPPPDPGTPADPADPPAEPASVEAAPLPGTPPAPAAPVRPDPPAADPVCGGHPVAILGVGGRGTRIRVTGITVDHLAGDTVAIRRGSRTLGKGFVLAGGHFAVTVPRPAGKGRITAVIGTDRSLPVRIERGLRIIDREVRDGRLRLTARLTRGRIRSGLVRIVRRAACTDRTTVRTHRIAARRQVTVTLPLATADEAMVFYRVLIPLRGAASYTLPVAVTTAG
ncbi:MAG: hypothetical protein ACJ762_09465 [Solirubrobacteraceae bacterium]